MARVDYWNHNVHYQPVILAAVPANCGQALEVGCGDGMLACKLADRCAEVTGIDRDARMIALARERALRQRPAPGPVSFAEADFLAYPLTEAGFDFVCANTSLHHMDFEAALAAMARVPRDDLGPGPRDRSPAAPRRALSPSPAVALRPALDQAGRSLSLARRDRAARDPRQFGV
jgi:SAM-dependent methyltransferase